MWAMLSQIPTFGMRKRFWKAIELVVVGATFCTIMYAFG
jgi:hypothetical protein